MHVVMAVEDALKKGAHKICQGRNSLINEEQVKLAVILPILRSLGWDETESAEFTPEFRVSGGGRVDYALCRAERPLVFIEAKKLGAVSDKGEEQLFGYASNNGVPQLVLTDGNIWDFYLSMAPGIPAERRFFRAELSQQEKIPLYAERFAEYLEKPKVFSGETRRRAEEHLESNAKKEEAKKTLSNAWQKLLQKPDERLRSLLVNEVEMECGTKPDLDDVKQFLRENVLLSPAAVESFRQESVIASPTPLQYGGEGEPTSKRKGIHGFVLHGDRRAFRSNTATLAGLIKELAGSRPNFMAEFAERTKGRRRRLVAQKREDLKHESDSYLDNGWWMGKTCSKERVRKCIGIACEIAGLRLGADITLIEG